MNRQATATWSREPPSAGFDVIGTGRSGPGDTLEEGRASGPEGGGGMRFEVRTTRREELVDITEKVAGAVAQAFGHGPGRTGVRGEESSAHRFEHGAVLVFCPHTTAAVTINENADPDVTRDLVDGLARIAPCDAGWRHCEGNSDGHLKSSLVGPSVVVPLESGRMTLGTWQGIYLAEFDGPRTRRIEVRVLPGLG